MNVADLQQHLADLQRLLKASGTRDSVLKEWAAVAAALAPFSALSFKEFADFLARAEAYRASGEVPTVPPKSAGRRPTSKTAGSQPKADAEDVSREIRELYERAASVEVERINSATGKLDGLKKDALVAIAEGIGMAGMKSKTKSQLVSEIRQRIMARKGGTIRAGMINRPDSPSPGQEAARPTVGSRDGDDLTGAATTAPTPR